MKICFIVSRIPWPLDKGDKLRAYYQIKYLSTNHDIILIATSESKIPLGAKDEMLKYCSEVHYFKLKRISQILNIFGTLISSLPFQSKYFYNKKVKKQIDFIIKKANPDLIFCQLIRMSEYVKDLKII